MPRLRVVVNGLAAGAGPTRLGKWARKSAVLSKQLSSKTLCEKAFKDGRLFVNGVQAESAKVA